MNLIVRSRIQKYFEPYSRLYKVKIAHAAWLRDRTWPIGMEAPDSDEKPNDERIHRNALTTDTNPVVIS
jgi:hypothetical protein